MHAECAEFVRRALADYGPFGVVVEFGGRDVNGSLRPDFGPCDYTSVDLRDGPGVDVVADARTWEPGRRFDAVLCVNVYEHEPAWRELVDAAARVLLPGGMLIATTVCDPFPPHSAEDGGPVRPGEYYAGVEQADLSEACASAGLTVVRELGVRPDSGVVAIR